MTERRHLIVAAVATGFAPWIHADAPWPSRPLRLVAGGAGSVTDIRGRWLAERLARALGQPVVVENNAAAGGNVGAEAVARAPADGHTLLFIHQGTAAANPHLFARPGYDPLTDFAPITRFGHGALLLTVHESVPAQSVAELIRLGKEKPGMLSFGSPGIGTPPHLASELFVRAAGIQATHVPYKGGGALALALLGGQVTWSMDGLTAQLPHVRSGRLRALAVTGAQRAPSLPDLPTIAEAGLPGYEYAGWTGLAAPARTPPAVIARLHAEIERIAASPEGRDWFAATGADAGVLTPEAFAAFIRSEHAKLGRLIREAGLKAE